ncbi:dystonin isoform X12 [Anarrhichthys ocellatus]|uniref:dystonin isoform X12 n=1 Tax=Anarrhichthys ocellatus TaxID=433405 RepID=UPI0012ED7FC3|nr:dystonin isoform X12 [Anarrhichthys ocellatus]
MMIAAAFLVLLRPYSIQCVLLLLLLLLGTIATILFFCCWHRRLRNGKHPIKSVLSGRTRSRVGLRTHHFRSEGFRHSPRHARRSIHARVTEEKPNLVEIPESEPDSSSTLRKRKVKKRVLPEFYQSVQVTPTRKPSSSSGNPSLHCSMSSSADFSDEDDYSVKSGSASPAPGDTLPWNLPRHERSKRKIQGGSVLDPAERAVLRIADERDRVQKKTFTKWINQHLLKVRKHINDLYEDLRDGHNLISLLEVLSGDTLPRERDFLKTLRLVSGTEACAVEQHGGTVDDDQGPRERGRMRFHRLQNVQIALDYLKRRQVKLVNIRNDDITDGNPKLTLGLIWTIILHFQISEIHVTGESQDMTAKERLLFWSRQITDGYVGVRCDNFTTSWRDGRLFNAIIHKYRPDLVDMSRVSTQANRSNLENAFCVAEQLGVARLLDPEDVDVQSPDEKSVITYVSTLYDAFPKVPDGVDGISPNDVDIKWVEYQNMIKYLSQWIRHNVAIMSDRSFPNNPVELKALYTQYLQFKEHEIPLKENEKTKIKNLYKMLEMWIEFGRIQLPQGHHPNDVEKEWGKLIVAMLEREKSLRPEVERLEMLQQIANRVQRDCVNGEDKLSFARTALQSDAKRLESGIQFLNEAEIAGYLLECENILRQQVVDIQILLDGKFPFADQLVQRVSELRDELLALRAECSSVYSKGRTLTTEQTKMMISGITQSLNSGYSQNINASLTPALTPAFTPGGLGTPGSTITSSLTPCLTPSFNPSLTPGLQPASVQSYMDPGSLRHLKNMQIRKPLLKSSLADPNMTEEEVNMKFLQDLLSWVEEMQLQLDRSEWGSDLPSVEMHLDNHKSVHRAIEEFQMSLKDAKLSEIQMTIPMKITYSDKLNKLEKQYERLLSCSRERQSHLESLHDFVSEATQELIWLNEKEEEEVAFDWSDRNGNISKKRDYHADLMRELDEKEEVIKSVQDKAERLMLKNHPARLTIEAYRAAMHTQWSWILQLCSCVEQHLKENAVYFEFFRDAKESMDYLKSLQDAIQRKYSCDRSSSLHRLDDLIQESMDEKEQLLQYRSTVAGLVGRAKNIVQLRPRNPESPVRSSIPVKAICDYRQIEITIYKEDECVLASNSHRAKWKVINPAGNEAMVPSVCFTVPPPNKEAVDMATRTEQLYQNVLALWHHSHINMKSVASWHYLMSDIRAIRNWNVASIKTMLQGEHQQVLSNLQSHFEEFLEDSEESEVFTVADCAQLERDVADCKEYYKELLRSAEREEHEESVYNHYISEIRNFRMHLEAHEEHLIRQLRTPLERDDLEQSLQRITEHERKTAELNKLKEDLDVMKEKCELFLRQAAASPSVPTLSSELTVLIQSMSQVYSMSSIYMDKLKTVSLVVRHSQSAEALVKAYESKLYEEDAMNSDVKSIETVISTLKQWRTEIDEKQEVVHDMEDELQRARVISDRMFKAHNERDFDLDWHKEKADQLSERWQNIHSEIDSRLRDLDGISKSLKHYGDSYGSLDEWVREMEAAQIKAQENKPEDSKALAELLNKQKVLVAEIEQKQSRIDECQKYSEQYSSAIKDYELQLMTFRAMVDSQHKSPLKKRRMQSSSDAIQQEFMDLRTRYTALVTLMTQYVKFASETLKRTEDEERSVDEEKREHGDKVSKLLHWMSNVKQTPSNDGNALKDSNANTDASNKPQVSVEEMVTKKEQIAEALRATQMMLNKHNDKMTEEEREKAQEQLKTLNQAYSELSQHCSDQTTSAEESLLEKHKEFTEKLEEVCDDLTLTENQLMGHQQQAGNAECVTDLQQYQQEHQALQKDVLTNASALNDVITSTKKFLEENRSKLMPDQIAIIESKLEEAKSKAKLINQRAEESRKDLEKVVTTAIKQESEKAAAVERLEESKNKIEGLLDWISNIGNENESDLNQADHISKENGNLPEETSPTGPIGADDDANGNALQATENDFGRETGGKNDASLQLDKQCDRVKARHQEILSQQQDLIMATQSAQALLDKQANVLSPEEKEKLQKNIQELKGRYEASLTQAEQQMKQVQCVQEELKKFQGDCEEFVGWLDQAEGEIEQLGTAASSLNILSDKLQRQRSFSEDVISHKGDLRFITMSGQKVLDVANTCGLADSAAKNALLDVDTSGTCSAVKDKLDSAASRYKSLHSQCNQLGNNLKDVVDKYKKYDDSNAGLLKWLNSSEEEARKQQSEAIAADPQTLQKQLEETKALQGQMTGHQTAIDTLRKAVESLITSEGDLLSNSDDIQETVDDIVERYDNLSKSVSDRNEKLQITLTRSMSVQDGLDEMMGWMEGVEASVKEKGQIPLDSASIGDILSKEAALEQDIASRQSSISAMKAKVKKFVETADPSAAALLQTKMDALSQRFSDSCNKHKQKVSQLEQLKEKVEQFEKVTDEVQQFVVKRSQDLHETEGPGKTFNELSQLMQNTKAEMAEHASDLEKLQTLSKELSEICPDGNKAQIQSKMDNLSNIFSTFKDTVNEKEEEVSSCQDQLGDFRSAASALTKWLEQTNEKVPVVQPSSSVKSLEKDLLIVTGLLDEWTFKDPAVQDLNSKGSALYSLMTFLTSPAKTKTANKSALTNGGGPASHSYLTNKELMVIQQNMSFINEGYASLGETLKGRAAELSSLVQEVKEAQKETDNVLEWLRDMKKTAASWNNAATEKDSVKTQLEQQKAFEDDMKQKQEKLQKLRETLLNLIRTHPNSPEAAKWKQMLAEIDAAWADISGSVEDRKQHLEQSNKNLDIFQTTERQLVQWLSEKELMMSVLGPLSIDPNMLKMQKQQVQILQNEFKSRKPQYEQLEEAASAILSSSGNQDPSSGKLVREQLTAVTQKWQGLTGQLNQRDSLIDQAVVKTGQFQELLKSVSQTATQLENQLTNHQGHSTQPEAVKKQLEDVHNISAQLREERKKLKEAEAINAELTAMVTEDYLKADLARQLDSVSKPFKQLEEKAEKRIEHLNSTFASSQQFQQTSKDFQSWLGEKLHDQSKPQPISAKVDILQQTLEEHSKVQKALSEHKEAYNTITGEGEMLLQNTDGAEKLALQGQLTTLSSNWEEVKKSSVEQADKLQTALQKSLKYQEHAEKLSSWIQEIEASEGRVKLTVDPVAVESSISQVKALQKDVDKHRGMAEQLNAAADSLLEVANADTDAIEEEKASIGKRVDNVVEGLQSKRESLEKISHTVKDFNDAYKEAKGQLEGAKKQVVSYESQGVQAHSNKNLTNMKAQQKSLEGVQNQVEHLKTLAKDLVVEVPDADGVTDLLLQADSMEQDYSTLNKKLEETCQVLEGKLQGIGQFQNQIREMFTRFTDLDDELDSMAPVDLDLATLKEQQDSIQTFVAKLQEVMANTANAGDSCKKMLETETSPDLLGLKRDLDALSKQSGKLLDRAKGREVQVQNTLTKLEELYGKLHQAEDTLCSAVGKEAAQEAVGMETDGINQQLEAFKAFQKEDIDPLKTRLQDISSLGQSLIQNAAKGTSTKKLEDDLEEVNTKWNTLNKKIAERSAQLHEALLHCGRFQDALESLLSWLTDTEELVANQKPPSAEFKVVKAQIQEQKLLQRLLDDRKPTVELIKKEGERVAELAESVDKEKVAKEIECLGQRWDTLLKKAENRHKQLEIILVVTQQFHETLEPLSEWLAATEKHLANSEPIGTETSKLEDQISQHKALQSDIVLRKKNVDQAISNGMELLKQTTGDEVVVIQGKLDGIKTKYAEINSTSDSVLKTLERVSDLSTKLQHTHEDLSSWLEKVEAEVSAFADQEPAGEQLIHAQSRQKALLKESKDQKPAMDKLNELSSSLLDLIPWHTRESLDRLVTEDNERYRAVCDTVTQQVEQINADILKSQQFEQAADTELSWLTEAERKLLSMGEIRLEQDQTTAQLQAQKIFSMDIMRHKDAVDGIVKTGKAIMNSKNPDEKEILKARTQTLLGKYGMVSQLNSERCLQLERAQSMASQFWETYEEMWPWLQETLSAFSRLPPPSIEYETLRQQQEELRQMRELIAEHKPHIDKMNKTGPQLLELSPVEGVPIREKYTATDQLYTKLKADVKQRAATLDDSISKSTQFHDKIDPMLESLERIAERLRQPPSISVEVEKIREQITENKAVSVDLEKLQPSYETLRQRGEEMIARSEGADKDISAKVVQDKLDQMVFLWSDIQALMEEREAKLLDVMDMADKFWCDHCALIVTIKDSQDLLRELEEPGVDPSVVKQQQEFVEGFKEEIDGLQEELEVVQNQGAELMTACGEPDKPVIRKSLDEVNSAWENLNKAWKERVERLEEAMQAAVQFQDGLQGMFDWVDILEGKLDSMSPVGTDLETVKQQISELKEFKGEAYQLQIEMERLNHQAGLLLKKVTDEADRSAIQEPMSELKMLWENLDEKIISRQHKLEGGLLALGQFQHALDELLAWMSHTEELLNDQRKAGGDPKAVEIELAKHHVLQNDVLAHKATVETVNKAGNDLVESTAGEEASSLQIKLESLNQRWKAILEKSGQRKQQLQSALLQAQGFHGEIEDMQQWLKDTERQLLASKAVGGLPDTAREQLNAHLELCSAFEVKEELYQELMNKGQQLLAVTPEGPDSNTEQDLANLQDKWEAVQGKSAERKVKLEEALTLATDFHNSLQDFINWLTQAEQTLNMVSPASLILDTIMFQIDEHKMFVTEVNSHREQIIELDKTGTHLKYFSQKQDVVLIKNLLLSVQGRWEKLVQRSVERGRLLDDARKRAKQFHETWNKLMEWLDDSEKTLDSEVEIANDPDKIKTQLSQHKEFQKAVGSKHSVYDTTTRTGRALKDKTSLRDDNQKLDDMLSELRDKWDTVCGKSVERQNKLEEALLFSGQFTDALQALIDWLYRVEPQLAEDQPVHGDIDLVLNLIDNHKVFQKELGKRTVSVQALKRSAKELIESSHDDSSWVKAQMQELSTRWETVCNLSVSKQARLEQALCQAEEFHSTVHILLEWLAEAEQSLRFHGSLPDDEEALQTLIEQHKEFMKKLEEKRAALNKATSMGEAILVICHPDSITTIKHWNTIIKARLEEVQAWARQHQQRLATALTELLATQDLLENLLTWLQWAETNLNDKDKEQLPQELEEVKGLIAEHQAFMEEMTRKQPDVDKITKTHKRKAAVEPPIHSHIPVLDKGRTGRKRSPTQTMYASATQPPIETKNPRVNLLVTKWQHVWLLALDRRRKLNDALDRLEELKEFANFDFDVWRKRYMRWMNHKKSRVMDFFRRIDKDQDGKVTRQEFIEGILSSKFPTSRLEMSAVADIFDRDGDGYIDYYEFVAALHPNKDAYKPLTDADKIEDEVTRQVAKCKCTKRFQVEQIGANKYRFYLGNQFGLVHCLHDSLIGDETIANRESQNLTPHLHVAVLESCILFGDSQQLRLVRILRSTVMVRVGGGWMALDEFLVKNDPCRVHHHGSKMLRSESNSSITQSPIGWQISNYLTLLHEPTCAKGRTNLELREKFILPEGTTQVMASFRYRGRRSRPSSRAASPNRSTSSQSCAVPSNPAVTSTPKTPQHIVRNYDKPWLTNSKPSTPLKSSDSFGSQGSSSESTPVQGSKLRLPGYLSGKGFQSGEEGTLISAAVLKARTQMIGEPRKNSSRPGSKAGSRGSSRRGSDASDFDISDIQSVCSDVSETVGESTRATPRSTSRQRGGKPSKIPTPQRRATPTSKLAKASKR